MAPRLSLSLIAALIAWPALATAAAPDCSRKSDEIPARLIALRDCAFATAEPMGWTGDAAPDAVAAAALAACPAQHEAALSYAKACDADLAGRLDTMMRGAVVDFVDRARLPRADRLWSHGDWQKGACALDNPALKTVIYAHLDCIRGGVLSKVKALSQAGDVDLAGLVEEAAGACAVKQAPVRAAFARCIANPDALTASYRAGAMESVLADLVDGHVTGKVLSEAQQKDEKLRHMIDDYGACVALEAHLRKGQGPVEDARKEAIRVCGLDRMDLTDAVAISLLKDQQEAIEHKIDILAVVEATLELPEPASASAGPAPKLSVKPGADPKCADAMALGEQVVAVRDCVIAKADALAATDVPANAMADQALAACASERGKLADYQKLCRLDASYADVRARKAIEDEVAERRLPRADRLWTYADGWAKGACAADAPPFKTAMNDHLQCMFEAAVADPDPNVSTGGAAAHALPKCLAQEAKVTAIVRGCAGARTDAVMDGYRAWAQEAAIRVQLDQFVDDKARAALPEMQGTDYFDLLETYISCVALEARLRHGQGARDAILDQARDVCAASRKDLAALVAERLDKDKQDARLTTADRTARGIAASGLDELDGKPPAPGR